MEPQARELNSRLRRRNLLDSRVPPDNLSKRSPRMFDSNQAYCLRLAEVTFPLLLSRPASTAASDAPRSPRSEDSQESEDPLNARPSIYDELHQLFGGSPDQPVSWLSSIQSLAAALELRPDIQSRLAVVTQYTPSKWLLERELQAFSYWPTPPPKHHRDCPGLPHDGRTPCTNSSVRRRVPPEASPSPPPSNETFVRRPAQTLAPAARPDAP